MQNLTEIERALLEEFERLASAYETLVKQHGDMSARFSDEIKALSHRQNRLEEHLSKVNDALARQTSSTTALIEKLTTLRSH